MVVEAQGTDRTQGQLALDADGVWKGFQISRWIEVFPKFHQTFQVPKIEVLSYISCM